MFSAGKTYSMQYDFTGGRHAIEDKGIVTIKTKFNAPYCSVTNGDYNFITINEEVELDAEVIGEDSDNYQYKWTCIILNSQDEGAFCPLTSTI